MKQIIKYALMILAPYSKENYSSRQRILNMYLALLSVVFTGSFLENLALHRSKYAIFSLFSLTFILFLYYMSRFRNVFNKTANLLFIYLFFIFAPVVWHEKGLTKSVLPFFFIMSTAFSLYIFEGRRRLIFILLSLLLTAAFFVGEMSKKSLDMPESINQALALATTLIALVMLGYYSIERFKQEKKRVEDLSRYDYLTGLFTRREGLDRLNYLIELSKRTNKTLSLIMMDIDNFKKVNDSFGHNCGDKVLKEVTTSIRRNIRQTDIPIRWGGEEFLIVLPETGLEEAYSIAERVRKDIGETKFECNKKRGFKITVTCGVSIYDKNQDVHENIERVDKALYTGKREGKNRTVVN